MDIEDVKKAIVEVETGDAVLIDVRTDEERLDGYAKPALHFNSKRMEAGELPEGLDKNKSIYLYCRGGGRAGRMKTLLISKGFENVHNLGGYLDWKEAGGEVVNPPSEK